MNDYQKDFASFEDRIWLNAASEGPLPLVSAQALQEAVEWKSKPYLLDIPRFVETQKGLKESIGQLIHVPYRDVILANSASYGLHILANGIPWQQGDEVILMHNDFPADILPWLALETQGVKVHQVKPRNQVIEPEELAGHVTGRTKLVCLPHVHTFTGVVLDIAQCAQICQDKGIIFVVNITQSAGTMPVDCSAMAVDAVVCASYKWLCGPYGTGFCWIRPAVRDQLQLNRAYWPAVLSDEELKREEVLQWKDVKTARKYDVFGTANFFNFVPLKAAIDYWLKTGVEEVRACHDQLIDSLIAQLDKGQYRLISPEQGKRRSSLVFITHSERGKNEAIFRKLIEAKIYPAVWKGNIRLTPHVYNTPEEINTVTKTLNTM